MLRGRQREKTSRDPYTLSFLSGLLHLLVAVALTGKATSADAKKDKPAEPAWGAPAEAFRLSLRSSQVQCTKGQTIRVQLVLQNVGNKTRPVDQSDPLNTHQFQVMGPDGKLLPISNQGKATLKNARQSSWKTTQLDPNKELSTSLDLAEVYDFAQSGEYRIVASRHVCTQADETKYVTLSSNPLTIKIVERANKKGE